MITTCYNTYYASSCVDGALQLINVSDPSSPVLVGTVSGSTSALLRDSGHDVATFERGAFTYAFVHTGLGRLMIDISDPSNPAVVDSHSFPLGVLKPNPRVAMFKRGASTFAITSNSEPEILLLDVSDPTSPVEGGNLSAASSAILGQVKALATFERGGSTFAMAGQSQMSTVSNGQTQMATNASNAVLLLDVSDPANPNILATLTDGADGGSVKLIDTKAIASFEVHGLLYAIATGNSGNSMQLMLLSSASHTMPPIAPPPPAMPHRPCLTALASPLHL